MKIKEDQSLFFIVNTHFFMMKTFEIDEYVLDLMIQDLKDSIAVCHAVDSGSDEVENSYPYATGYSRSCMTGIVETLERVKNCSL